MLAEAAAELNSLMFQMDKVLVVSVAVVQEDMPVALGPEGDRHGTDYTGGGGGGYGYQPDIWAKGGKGVVIVRY